MNTPFKYLTMNFYAAEGGFEPPQTPPKGVVLPLDDRANNKFY